MPYLLYSVLFCGAVDKFQYGFADGETAEFFDHGTGALIAIGVAGNSGGACIAGPSDTSGFDLSTCSIISDACSLLDDAGAEAGVDVDACAPSGCTGSCLSGAHNVSTVVDGCTVWRCCVPDDAGVDVVTDAADASSD